MEDDPVQVITIGLDSDLSIRGKGCGFVSVDVVVWWMNGSGRCTVAVEVGEGC